MSIGNHISLIGRLTKDPAMTYTQKGDAVTKFSLAVERDFKNSDGKREADFFNVTTFTKLAEICGKYLHKGKQIAIEGRMQQSNYLTKDTQEKRTSWEVIAGGMKMLGSKDDNQGESRSESTENRTELDNNIPDGYGLATGSEDEVPF